MEVVSVERAKAIDDYTINAIGIPSIVLMENAAQEIYSNILHKGEKYFVVCGVGNNGGDGLAIARKLLLTNKIVSVLICGDLERGTKDFSINYSILKNMKTTINVISKESSISQDIINDIREADVVVDSIFGIGLSRNITGIYYEIIKTINENSKYIVAVDVPSGIDGNNGEVKGIAIKANETYTVEVYKKGFFMSDASEYLGDIFVIQIGFPHEVIKKFSEDIMTININEYKKFLPKRKINSHKGDLGKVLVLAGSEEYTGAPYITTQAVVKTGAGLVTLVVPKEIKSILATRLTEAMIVTYEEGERISELVNSASVIACGPGLSNGSNNINMLKKIINTSKCPLVLDADALNIISKNRELLNSIKGRAIITPHNGEMSRVCSESIDYIKKNRISISKKMSLEHNIITLLKGYNTVITNGKETIINTTGSSKMASGGMGDCLTGIITSLIAQGVELFNATILACYIHGFTGDKISQDKYIVNASEIINELPKVMEELNK